MKRIVLLVVVICAIIALCACSKLPTITTALGDFGYKQEFMPSIVDDQGNKLDAGSGNILLVAYLTPSEGTDITLDQASAYFNNGTQAVIDNQTYDLNCIAFEKVNGTVRYGLVFEVTDNNYEKNEPKVSLRFPKSSAVSPVGTNPASVTSSPASVSPTVSVSPTGSTAQSS